MNDMRHKDQVNEKDSGFNERVVSVDRVARVVKGGRRFRFRALVVIGDGKGQVGVGLGKGLDVTAAVAKATDSAKKHLSKVVIVNGTLPHESFAKAASAKVLIKPAAPGTGIIAGGVVRVVLEAAGYSNALSKSLGSSNKVNMAYATVDAMRAVQPREKWVTTKKAVPKKTAKAAKETA